MKPTEPLDDDSLERHLRASRQLRSAPHDVLQRIVALYDRRPRPAPPLGLVRRMVQAVLELDSWAPGSALAGVRNAAPNQRQLLFRLEQHDVELSVRRSAAAAPQSFALTGQVVGPEEAGEVELQCGEFRARVAWSAHGEFQLEQVPGGECVLRLRAQTWETTLPAFTLSAARPAADG
jgi:hypothetical protein